MSLWCRLNWVKVGICGPPYKLILMLGAVLFWEIAFLFQNAVYVSEFYDLVSVSEPVELGVPPYAHTHFDPYTVGHNHIRHMTKTQTKPLSHNILTSACKVHDVITSVCYYAVGCYRSFAILSPLQFTMQSICHITLPAVIRCVHASQWHDDLNSQTGKAMHQGCDSMTQWGPVTHLNCTPWPTVSDPWPTLW